MRRYSAGVAVVIDDEPAVRSLLASILSDYGCAVATSRNAGDLQSRIAAFSPDILFLDIGLRHSCAFDLLDLLAASAFSGAIQIVSGRGPDVLARAFRKGAELGLHMRSPLAKPFRADAIGQILQTEGLLAAPNDSSSPDRALLSRAWTCASSPTVGLVDLRADATGDGATSSRPAAEQLRWWAHQRPRFRAAILGLPAPATICLDARIADIPALMPNLSATEYHASHPAPTIVLREEDVLRDVDLANTVLCAVRLRGAAIRVTGCGPRFFGIMADAPLPVDHAVLDPSPAVAGRIAGALPRIAALLHRAGSLLFADDLPPHVDPTALDLWRPASRGWQSLASPPQRAEQAWRPVPLIEALSMRKSGRRA